ncbi:MAG: hypothetical protein ACOX04_09380 [Candidatus Scatomorpha sp.]|jgi:hypothetical protein
MKKLSAVLSIFLVFFILSACGEAKPKEVKDMAYSVTVNESAIEGSYSGTVLNELPEGEGTFISSEPGVYEYTGAWAEGKISGKGNLKQGAYTVKFVDGTERVGEYEGETLNGLPEGQGVFHTQNLKGKKYYYEGEWKNGLWNGQGKTVHETGQVKEGRWENCIFTPTPLELFTIYFTHFNCSICANAQEFIKANEDLFYKDVADIPEELLDKDFEIEKLKENPNSNIKGIVESNNLTVIQTQESDADPINLNFPKGIISLILAKDEQGNIYFCYMVGSVPENVAEGSNIKLSFLPLNYFEYKTAANEYREAVACAAVKID